jgi:acyl transferase domain-containing protein/NAD(P)H-dependent flavin oxidoreductase YrpB (nitropropane dioxygenase family)
MFSVWIIAPANLSHAKLAIAAARANATVFIDIGFCREGEMQQVEENLAQTLRNVPDSAILGLRLRPDQAIFSHHLLTKLSTRSHGVLLTGWDVHSAVKAAAALPFSEKRNWYLEVIDAAQIESLNQVEISLTGLVAKGHECGGWVGESSSFILTQQLLEKTIHPVHVQGGIGPSTAAACFAAGAAGVVLDDQLWLMPESPFPPHWRNTLKSLNGSETALCGERLGAPIRMLNRPGFTAVKSLRRLEEEAEMSGDVRRWMENAPSHLGWGDPAAFCWPVGQSIGMAASLAKKYHTTGRLIRAIREEAQSSVERARELEPLAPNAPLACSHCTRYPIVQGPMTRVSDVAPFASAVAKAGGLPMLALALLRGPQVDRLLRECKSLLDGHSWGVGILGFVPPALREEQLAVVHQVRPPFALVAGGQPEDAAQLEREGIATYLHVPTPELLELFLARGSRRFVFEGRECGGHVGPLSSFCLWESMIAKLLEEPEKVASDIHVLFAGGIHDGRTAAMISALAAPLAERGVKIGVLMGTAYLFSHEAVECGAIVPGFQEEALKCSRTINLETGPGHAIRCIVTPFANEFHDIRRSLARQGLDKQTITRKLDELTIGRLRVASKGLRREGSEVVAVDEATQYREGMYMIGQAASMRSELVHMEDLHAQVSAGSIRVLDEALASVPAEAIPPGRPSDIAIIGISVLLPGAHNLEQYWTNILRKTNCITEIPPHRWDWRLYYDSDKSRRDKIYSKWGGFLDEIPFDPLQFGIPPSSLKSIEPMQLLALEATRRALIDAGYENGGFNKENTSVIFGVSGGLGDLGQQFAARSEIPRTFGHAPPDVLDRLPEWTGETFPGLLFNIVTGRIANRFDFGGSNYTIDAACASSLAALDQAVRELEIGACDVALAGGVDTMQSPFSYICFSKTQALSPQGVSRAFDEAADGIVLSEGVGILVLKRLADAQRDGDRIYAVIKATGSSSDGRGASMTAPTNEGQMRAMSRAYRKAGISPATVGFYEAHGTGTAVGDRVELDSYAALLAENAAESNSCAIGSVKTLIGHTKSAAGVAGIAKAALALHHKALPAHGAVDNPLPGLRDPQSPFYLLQETAPWIAPAGHPRRAAVSAFGFGGTNFHAILEEYQGYLEEPPHGGNAWPCELFVWKSKDRDLLIFELEKFQRQVEAADELTLRDLALSTSRQTSVSGKAALSIVSNSRSDLSKGVEAALRELREPSGRNPGPNIFLRIEEIPIRPRGALAFLFPGQGAQYPHPAQEAALFIPEIAGAVQSADAAFEGLFEKRFSKYLYPAGGLSAEEIKHAAEQLSQTQLAQPAIGVISCGYLDFLRRLEITPDVVAGHSYGEYTALHAAGVFSRADFLQLSYVRGQTMGAACEKAPGAMAAVLGSREEVSRILEGTGVRIANHNSPRQTVITGSRPGVEAILEKLQASGISGKLLPVGGAFHSPLMDDAQGPLAEAIATVSMAKPQCTVFSNTTGLAYVPATEEIRELLSRHMLNSVEFVREIEAMYNAGVRIFLEVGPRTILTSLVEKILKGRPHFVSLAVDSARGYLRGLLQALGKLFVEGVDFDASRLFSGRPGPRLGFALKPASKSSRGKTPQWLLSGGCVRTVEQKPGISGKLAPLTADDVTAGPPSKQKPTQSIVNAKSEAPVSEKPAANSQTIAAGPITPQAQVASLHAYASYQETMRQFLKVQEEVMRQFLGGGAIPSGSHAPEESVALPLPTLQPIESAASPAQGPASQPAEPFPAPGSYMNGDQEKSPVTAGPPKASAEGNGVLDRAGLTNDLLVLVSERTGYPAEMLGLEQDVEADLGIDSIKRVEIFGAFQNHLPSDLVARLSEDADLTKIRTLKGWIDAVMEKAA